jgi:propionate CoA-transferase
VKYVDEKYYISVSRYTNSGFLRLKLGNELSKRKVSSRIYESSDEAARHLIDK